MAESYLRRYTDIPALVYLLTERKITLVDPQSWDDANDSYYLSLYREKKKLGSVLALCFTQTSERYHHWRVFAHGSGGVCVSFKRPELVKAVKPVPDLRCESVTYLRLNQIRRRKLDPEELPFLKRYPFQDEREFRMVWESKKKGKSAFDIPVPLSCIDKVMLSPWLRESLAGQLKGMLKRIEGCAHLRITRSTLISNEQWKNLGESVAEEKRVVGT